MNDNPTASASTSSWSTETKPIKQENNGSAAVVGKTEKCLTESRESLEINVNNVVCSYSTKCHLNLRRIALEGMHVEYKKENGMLNMKLRKPYTTATIWSSGKITCAGAKSESDAYKAARRYCRLLQKMQFKVKMSNYRVVNVLATCTLPFHVDIIGLSNQFKKECSYEPELHPGATFRLKELKSTLKLFTTGSITLTSPSVDLIHKSITHIYPILYQFRHGSSHASNNDNNNSYEKNDTNTLKSNLIATSYSSSHQQQQQLNDFKHNTINNNNNNNILLKSCSNNNIVNNNLNNFSNGNNNNNNNSNNNNNNHINLNQFYNETQTNQYIHHQIPSIYSTDASSLTNTLTTNGNMGNAFVVGSNLPYATHSGTSSLSNSSHHWFTSYDSLLIDNVNVDDFLP